MIRGLVLIIGVALIRLCPYAHAEDAAGYKIGVVYGLTGAAQVWGAYGRMGLELARDEINAAGGVNGKPIQLIIEDSKTNPTASVSAYRKLVTQDNVSIVVGDVWDFITNPMIPLAKRDGVVLISPTTMPHALEKRNDHVFTAGHTTGSIAGAVDHFFKLHPSVKRVGILCWDDPWGHAYLATWREAAARNGASVVATFCNVDFNTDYRTDVLKIAQANVDAIFIAHLADVALKRIKEQKIKAAILTSGNVVEDIKVKLAPKELFEGIYLTDWRPSEEFIEKFSARYGKEPVVEAHNSYETLRAVAKALAIDPTNPAKSLRKVRYTGVGGELDFSDPVSASQADARLYAVRRGEIELVGDRP